ncbi:MAG: hypothetical protein ACE5H4_05230 [Candidatus Thorarchaeota archaeon]
MSSNNRPEAFDWQLYPQAEKLLLQRLDEFLAASRVARNLSARMTSESSTRLFDWIDHIVLPNTLIEPETLLELGFVENHNIERIEGTRVFEHNMSILFPVLVSKDESTQIALKPEDLDRFLQMNGRYYAWPGDTPGDAEMSRVHDNVEGTPYSPYRRALVNKEGSHQVWAVERRGWNGYAVQDDWASAQHSDYELVLRKFLTRRRHFSSDRSGLEATLELVRLGCDEMAEERVADAFFRAERQFWMSRERGGQVQWAGQSRLGLGWGNHDHHTFRSSRENFHLLIQIFETMGFEPREQFFAGQKAGWGAQVLEHPVCHITIFADVDISVDERNRDFAHEPMEPSDNLGTIGLWVALHGESILQAGMHHLAARVDFSRARAGLERYGIRSLYPFSDFKFLKQAFVESERRPVESERLELISEKGLIDQERRNDFGDKGAIGSHIEIIQRGQGFKGFNQDSVSVIISATDPRKHTERNA